MIIKNLWEKAKSVFPVNTKVEKVLDEGFQKAQNHTFTLKVSPNKDILPADVERIITLNPWVIVGSKPHVFVSESTHDEKQIEIQFKAISKRKANLVAQQIQDYIETL